LDRIALLNLLDLEIDKQGYIIPKKIHIRLKPKRPQSPKAIKQLVDFYFWLQKHRIGSNECSLEALNFLCQYYFQIELSMSLEEASRKAMPLSKTLYILSK